MKLAITAITLALAYGFLRRMVRSLCVPFDYPEGEWWFRP